MRSRRPGTGIGSPAPIRTSSSVRFQADEASVRRRASTAAITDPASVAPSLNPPPRAPMSSGGRRRSRTGARPAEHLDPNPIRVEDEEGVVVLHVAVLLRREVDPCASGRASLVRRVDLVSGFYLEGEVLDSDVVVVVGAAIGRTESEHRARRRLLEIDDLLGS